ncbi:hypothetical protein HY604_02950 [Candidatus Peregrinibacteria bacterium]|nr:hypothetical protein [Candidatus Peregrinibacteria bacterium]
MAGGSIEGGYDEGSYYPFEGGVVAVEDLYAVPSMDQTGGIETRQGQEPDPGKLRQQARQRFDAALQQ